MTLRHSLLAGGLLLAAAWAPAWAARVNPQLQAVPSLQRMKGCEVSASARGLRSATRVSFLSQCLRGGTTARAPGR